MIIFALLLTAMGLWLLDIYILQCEESSEKERKKKARKNEWD
tara:strand:+ start:539 stop:664 length:126 start_codon:yes stop_codon:yes gene_type:complete